ncbi:MAG: ABC transporter ATP-binding protein [Planctomycetes bacterium]|nr:ABC transporter ATP-binding protein [Planctomycetota bacterium]
MSPAPAPAAAPAAAPALAIRCRGVEKSYGSGDALVHALRKVDLDVAMGELLMLVGPSGCGKTTLISVLAGILDADAGEVAVLGADLRTMAKREVTRWRGEQVGFVFQAYNLVPTLTVEENVAIPLLLRGTPRRLALARAGELLEQVGLGARRRSAPRDLSGGQQQRVAIARSLVHEPRLLVCDEPTSALDAETGHGVMELLRAHAVRADRALVLVTHDSRIFEFADRIARMEDGRIRAVEPGRAALATEPH